MGAFNWYGIIIVTGALDFTGGGEKNITGAILNGETALSEVGGWRESGYYYCSGAITKIK